MLFSQVLLFVLVVNALILNTLAQQTHVAAEGIIMHISDLNTLGLYSIVVTTLMRSSTFYIVSQYFAIYLQCSVHIVLSHTIISQNIFVFQSTMYCLLCKPLTFLSVSQQAFWCLVQICEKYLPGYYSAGLVSE